MPEPVSVMEMATWGSFTTEWLRSGGSIGTIRTEIDRSPSPFIASRALTAMATIAVSNRLGAARAGRQDADPDVCHKPGISSATLYGWKAKYAGIDVSRARKLKVLEEETTGSTTAGRRHARECQVEGGSGKIGEDRRSA